MATRWIGFIWRALPALLVLALGCRSGAPDGAPARLEPIVRSADGRGFVKATSQRPFHPWGMNYGNAGRLMEDFWDTDWDTLAGDFRELHELGANVVRIHLQFGEFMKSPTEKRPESFARLRQLLELANATGVYLDITGLACYRPSDTPPWYDALAEPERWAAQARFWEAVAETCADHSTVFCYDLINEPISPASRREPGQWASGSRFGGFDFLQYIALDPAGRKREEIAVAWIRHLTAAIRRHDRRTLITVGMLPWSRDWKHLSGFLPEAVGPELDFLSVHIYPDSKQLGEAMECLRQFDLGRPVVIEETFPLSCSPGELEDFLKASRAIACGWIGHYDGQTPADLDALEAAGRLEIGPAIYRSWIRMFVGLKPEFSP